MKKQIIIIFINVFLLSNGTGNIFSQNLSDFNKFKESENEFKINREKWIKEMHRCAPDVNYEVIDAQNKIAKQELIKQKNYFKPLINKHFGQEILLDTFAKGKVIGEWIEKGSNNQAGRIHTLDIDFETNEIYAASAGGNIWKGSLEGNDWQCLNNTIQFKNIRFVKIIHNNNIKRIVVVKNSPAGVYYSDDDGNSWEKASGLEIPESWGWLNRGLITNSSQPIIYVLGVEWDYKEWKSISCLYRSRDLGISFEPVYKTNLNSNWIDIWTPKYDSDSVFIIHKDTISSIKADGSFEEISIAKTGIDTSNLSIIILNGCYSDNQFNLYLCVNKTGNDTTFFYSSTNGGQNWEYRGFLSFRPFERNSFCVSTLNNNIIYMGGVDTYRSYDGGKSWNLVNYWWEYYGDILNKLHADIPGIVTFRALKNDNFDEYVFIATDGGLYVSKDSLKTVKNISLYGLNVSQYYSTYTIERSVSDSGTLLAGSQDQGFQRCINDSNKTLSFQQTISGDYGHLTSSDGGKTLWCVYPGFAMVYSDIFRSSITSCKFWNFKGKSGLWMPPIVSVPNRPNLALLACGGINQDEAQLWQLELKEEGILSLVFPYNFNADKSNSKISAMNISPLDNKYLFVLTNNGKFFSSTDYGETWSKLDSFSAPSSHYFYGSHIEPSSIDLNKLYIAGAGYSNPPVFVSYDRGRSFIAIDSGLPRTLIYDIAVTPDEKMIFAATEVGPYMYISEDNYWYDISGSFAPDQIYWSVEWLPEKQTARFGTYGRGIWDFKIHSFTSIAEHNNRNIENNLKISVSPNPFYENVNITINTQVELKADVLIYDIEGRKVKEINSHILNVGENIITWDGKNFNGIKMPQGIYLVIVKVLNQIKFQSLKLIK